MHVEIRCEDGLWVELARIAFVVDFGISSVEPWSFGRIIFDYLDII
jgi:hypothetical protein